MDCVDCCFVAFFMGHHPKGHNIDFRGLVWLSMVRVGAQFVFVQTEAGTKPMHLGTSQWMEGTK